MIFDVKCWMEIGPGGGLVVGDSGHETTRAVTGHLAVIGVIQTHDLRQHVRIPSVGLRTRGGMRSRYRAADIGLNAYT